MDISQTTGRSRSVLPAHKIFAGKKKFAGLPRRRAGLRRGFGEGSSTHLFVGPAAAIPTLGCVSIARERAGQAAPIPAGISVHTAALERRKEEKPVCKPAGKRAES